MIQRIDQNQCHSSRHFGESHVLRPLAICLEHTTQRGTLNRFHQVFSLRHIALILALLLIALPAEAGPLRLLRSIRHEVKVTNAFHPQ